MKQLKSRSQDLRGLFEKSITIEYVAEPLKAVSVDADVKEVLHWMQLQDFYVVGVETENIVSGYVELLPYKELFINSEFLIISSAIAI